MHVVKKSVFVFAILLALCLSACKGANKMLGGWNVVADSKPMGVMTFTDTTMSIVFDDPGTHLAATLTGTYHLDGDQFYTTWKSAELTNVPAEGKGQEAAIKTMLEKQVHAGEERVATVKWTGDKSFSTTAADGTVATYNKV